ncbi:MAG: hypothetical protein IT213_11095 [Cytophagales bacterium]|nr:hypothetical protein [Cytophagales bacterium]
MKHTIIIVLFCLGISGVNGQIATNTKSANSSNVYFQAIVNYVESSFKDENKKVIVEKNYLFTDSLPKVIKSIQIEYLDGYEINKRLNKKNDELVVVRIVPLSFANGEFFINIIPFRVIKEKNNLRYLNSGGSKLVFTYNCETNSFTFKEIIRGNI